MDRISSYVSPTGVTLDFDIATRAGVEAIKDEWSSQGRRVLLLARKAISGTSIRADPSTTAFESAMNQQAKSGLTLVGLVGLVDPPRPEIPQVVSVLRGAGIRIFMVCRPFSMQMTLLFDVGANQTLSRSPGTLP
jgi:sodium/potassium-transporting ATPase subunit alpha